MNSGGLSKVTGIIVIATMIAGYSMATRNPKNDYGVIIDAGSSGSRVYVYYWRHREDTTTLPDVYPTDADVLSQAKTQEGSLFLNKRFINDAVQVGPSEKFVFFAIHDVMFHVLHNNFLMIGLNLELQVRQSMTFQST